MVTNKKSANEGLKFEIVDIKAKFSETATFRHQVKVWLIVVVIQ